MPNPCAGKTSGQGRCSGSWWRSSAKARWQSTALLENLLNNSVRHNPKPVNITVYTRRVGERFCLTVADDGIGYPPAVLAALNAAEPAENAPHILGLYVVQQIAAAHGGRAVFGQNTPHGAKAVVYLPLG